MSFTDKIEPFKFQTGTGTSLNPTSNRDNMFGLFKKKIPDSTALYLKYFAPWINAEDRMQMARPDLYQIGAYEGVPLDLNEIQYLNEEYLEKVSQMVNETMKDAALSDFSHIYKSDLISLDLLDAVDRYYDRKQIAALIKESDPKKFDNEYLVIVCEFGVLLGQLFRQLEGFDWLYSYPYFNSIIVHEQTGFGIPVFDWAIKKFSEYGVDDGFVAKFQMAIDGVNGKWPDDDMSYPRQ